MVFVNACFEYQGHAEKLAVHSHVKQESSPVVIESTTFGESHSVEGALCEEIGKGPALGDALTRSPREQDGGEPTTCTNELLLPRRLSPMSDPRQGWQLLTAMPLEPLMSR